MGSSPITRFLHHGDTVKQKKMTHTKVIQNLTLVRKYIRSWMNEDGDSPEKVNDVFDSLTRAIRMVKDHRKVFLEGIDDEFGGFR